MGSSSSSQQQQSNLVRDAESKRICVIGVGPVGLGALKVIKDSPQFKEGLWEVTAFESRERIGGIWVPAPPEGDPPLTALYDSLTANTPHPLMCYMSYPFPPATPLYPPATTILKYIEDYAAHFDLNQHIRLCTAVTAVHWDSSSSRWNVSIQSASGDETLPFDFVVVANGHFRVPRIPDTKGLAAWRAKGKVTHTAWYRRPQDYSGKILIVGGGYSGQDVVADTRPFATGVVHSITGATPEDEDDGRLKIRGRVAEYLDPEEGKLLYEDGTTESGVDTVILATGYQFHFHFLSEPEVVSGLPPRVPPIPQALYNSTYHIFPLAKHIFPLVKSYPPTSIAFLGLPLRVAPFPLAEVQAQAALKAFADPGVLDLDREAEALRKRYEQFRSENGDDEVAIADAWFRFGFDEMFDYRDELYEFIGDSYRIPQWERDLFRQKDFLREQWRELERAGESDAWSRDVGAGSEPFEEWAQFMWKVLRRTRTDGDAST
ncbi:FAD/NAD(P)-binding domain-containing protein [Lentinus tigrinus ALCF2SS1-7]|uniref:FAD/NAD(P)-binding domain-containing protein n=1 Tax=Lentinus tigrinus ALCF2SS1-7 TaxID=1328758 RepID=UPI0011660AD5|nr:FAD/NAD(P)-binding domain-containing protein [Lentinus tigrinus ALCF2SS1-7]